MTPSDFARSCDVLPMMIYLEPVDILSTRLKIYLWIKQRLANGSILGTLIPFPNIRLPFEQVVGIFPHINRYS